MNLRAHANLNDMLGQSMRAGGAGLRHVPELVKECIRDDTWREFVTKLGKHVEHERFEDFVAAQPLAGIGGTMELLQDLCRGDTEALDLLDQVAQQPAGGDRRSDDFKRDIVTLDPNPRGNSESGALRRLRKDAPELHAEVLAGHMSAHRAMVQAGFRKKTITLPVDPEAFAKSIARYFTDEQFTTLLERCHQLRRNP